VDAAKNYRHNSTDIYLKSIWDIMNYIHPKMMALYFARRRLAAFCKVLAILFYLSPIHVLAQDSLEKKPAINQLMQGKAYIYKLYPADKPGQGYKLVYMVAAPLDTYWNFKTDFENDFLMTNKLITGHRLVEYRDNIAITETIYSTKPGVRFRWRTISSTDIHRLDFELLNPNECGQKFHYGHIQLEAFGEHTKVTQTAYFDFFGATLWMNYPWYGGMHYYLQYTVRWEQETIVRLNTKY
jgi:hypothetical protein